MEHSLARDIAEVRDAPEGESAKFVARSDDVAARKRVMLTNFLVQGFPECVFEGRVDFDVLRRALGDWVDARFHELRQPKEQGVAILLEVEIDEIEVRVVVPPVVDLVGEVAADRHGFRVLEREGQH